MERTLLKGSGRGSEDSILGEKYKGKGVIIKHGQEREVMLTDTAYIVASDQTILSQIMSK